MPLSVYNGYSLTMQCEQVLLQMMLLHVVSYLLHWATKQAKYCHPQPGFSYIGIWISSEHSMFTDLNVAVVRLMNI